MPARRRPVGRAARRRRGPHPLLVGRESSQCRADGRPQAAGADQRLEFRNEVVEFIEFSGLALTQPGNFSDYRKSFVTGFTSKVGAAALSDAGLRFGFANDLPHLYANWRFHFGTRCRSFVTAFTSAIRPPPPGRCQTAAWLFGSRGPAPSGRREPARHWSRRKRVGSAPSQSRKGQKGKDRGQRNGSRPRPLRRPRPGLGPPPGSNGCGNPVNGRVGGPIRGRDDERYHPEPNGV